MSTIGLQELYKDTTEQIKRYDKASSSFKLLFGTDPDSYYSAPGRTEILGNHTDHNHGKVVAAAINLDIIAAVSPTDNGIITVKSESFDKIDIIDTSDLCVKEDEVSHSAALIRGVCAGLKSKGYKIGGFNAFTTSDVLKGSGLSSSAAFEVLIATIISHLYNEGKISAVEAAQTAQYAENVYFGKPSGLMDQMASSVGSFITIDFKDTDNPLIETLDFDLSANGVHLCIIDTKGSHAELTPEYAAIPKDMKSVAAYFGKQYLRELSKKDLMDNLDSVRDICKDRAVLRAIHFFDENERVDSLCRAIRSKDFGGFLSEVSASGDSSYKYLQNVFPVSDPCNQSVSLALYMCQSLLHGKGAYRVHGGGFAGTVQAFVPDEMLHDFKNGIEKVFGSDSCHVLSIRPVGGTKIIFSHN